MSNKKDRTSIIDSVSNWIKLLALIVLVAEGIILVAMSQTPVDSSVYPWYPFVMILLLIMIVIAVLLDRYLERNTQRLLVNVDNNELVSNPNRIKTNFIENKEKKYVNGLLGYSFDKLRGSGWSEPIEITYIEYLSQIFLWNIENIDENQFKQFISAKSPFGTLFFHANILEVQKFDDIVIDIDDQSTTEPAEYVIQKIKKLQKMEGTVLTEDQIVNLRRRINETEGISQIGFGIKFNVITFKKRDLDNNAIPIGLPNLFLTLCLGSREPIDSISSNDQMILWTTSNKLRNCIIEGERVKNFNIYRSYQLVENSKYIYLNQIQWSPQLRSSVIAWEELKNAFESFKIEK